MRPLPNDLRDVIARQSGVVTRRQLLNAGFLARDVNRRVEAGLWQPVSSKVISSSIQPLTRLATLWAASLHHESAGLTGVACLEVAGFPQGRQHRIDLLSPRGTLTPPFDDCVLRTSVRPRFITDDGPMRTSVDVALVYAISLARTHREATFFTTWALQRGLATVESVDNAVEHLPLRRGRVRVREVLAAISPGVHSMHEFDFARECIRRGLPEPVRQQLRRDAEGRNRYTDVEFRVGNRTLVVEIDGIGHLDTEVRLDDQWRENELVLQGAVVLRIPGLALRMEPDRYFAQIKRALTQLRAA